MKKIGKRLKIALERFVADVYAGKFVILLFLLYIRISKWIFGSMCPMVIITGLPCPGCGLTRASYASIVLNFEEAIKLNPSVFFWLFMILWFLGFRYLSEKQKAPFINAIMVITILVSLGIYIYRMATVFPSDVPMTYLYKNRLAMLVPGYTDFLRHFWNI